MHKLKGGTRYDDHARGTPDWACAARHKSRLAMWNARCLFFQGKASMFNRDAHRRSRLDCWIRRVVKKVCMLLAASTVLSIVGTSQGAEPEVKHFRGVVTYHLIPAKVLRVNEIVGDPEPGTSYIGKEGLLVEFEGKLDVMANWSVVDVAYYKYEQPKTIHYKVFGKDYKVTVSYHAQSVIVDGDISRYIKQ
jgi:hypothetical protein